MAISTYSELQAAVTDWMVRSDISGSTDDFITLAEARLNRILEPVATTATLTGTIGSASVSISALDIVEPDALWASDGNTESFVTPQTLGTFQNTDVEGRPSFWAIEGTNIKFERPCDQAYSFRFIYTARLGLSDVVTTNEFLRKHPDMYLCASIYWGCVYIQDEGKANSAKAMWDEFLAEVRSNEAQKKRSILRTDPALSALGWRTGFVE